MQPRRQARSKWLFAVGPAAIIVGWWALTTAELIRPIFLPSPDAVVSAFVDLLFSQDGGMGPAVIATLLRAVVGLALGVVIGLPLGLTLGYFSRAYTALEVPLDFFRSIPVTALFPFFLLVFGIGDTCKVFIVAWAIALIITISAIYGVRGCSRTRERYLRSIGIAPWQAILYHILPEATPSIVGGLRISISQAFIVVVVTEMLFGAENGIGYLLYSAGMMYRTDEVVALILVAGILGYLVNKLADKIGKRIVFWQH